MMDGLMEGIAENAGEQAAVRARLLLDCAATRGPEEPQDPAKFRSLLLEQAKAFIESSGGELENHFPPHRCLPFAGQYAQAVGGGHRR